MTGDHRDKTRNLCAKIKNTFRKIINMNLVEFIYKNKSYMGYTDGCNSDIIHVFQTEQRFCTILKECYNKDLTLLETLQQFVTKPFFINALDEQLTWQIPALPEDLTSVHVFGFGYTHKNRALKSSGPECFYKGDGFTLFPHNVAIKMPKEAKSVSEEAELIALYYIEKNSNPILIGYAMGNDLSDPVLRRMDATQFANSKLRPSAIGAELCLKPLPIKFNGKISIQRANKIVWYASYNTGISQLLYSVETLTRLFVKMAKPIPDHFYYVFLGADNHSFANHFTIENEDIICIESESFVLALCNRVILT